MLTNLNLSIHSSSQQLRKNVSRDCYDNGSDDDDNKIIWEPKINFATIYSDNSAFKTTDSELEFVLTNEGNTICSETLQFKIEYGKQVRQLSGKMFKVKYKVNQAKEIALQEVQFKIKSYPTLYTLFIEHEISCSTNQMNTYKRKMDQATLTKKAWELELETIKPTKRVKEEK